MAVIASAGVVWPVIALLVARPSEIESFTRPAFLFASPVAENVTDFYSRLPAAPDKFFNFGSVGAGRGGFAEKRFHCTAPWVVMNW
jgi:hypothetical protein